MTNSQTAYIEGAFMDEQKELLKDVNREFELNRKTDGSTGSQADRYLGDRCQCRRLSSRGHV